MFGKKKREEATPPAPSPPPDTPTVSAPAPAPSVARQPLWTDIPDECGECGARVNHAEAYFAPQPRCPFCEAPLPCKPFASQALPAAGDLNGLMSSLTAFAGTDNALDGATVETSTT